MSPTSDSEPFLEAMPDKPGLGEDMPLPPPTTPQLFVGLAVGQGVFFGVFWSAFMAFWMGQPFLHILQGPGLACGVMFGISMGLFFAWAMRTSATSIPVSNRDAFRARVDEEMRKLRYLPESRSDRALSYKPRALIRPKAFHVVVRIGEGSASLVGPAGVLKALKKRLTAA